MRPNTIGDFTDVVAAEQPLQIDPTFLFGGIALLAISTFLLGGRPGRIRTEELKKRQKAARTRARARKLQRKKEALGELFSW